MFTAFFRQMGVAAFGVDHGKNRFKRRAPTLVFDLSTQAGVDAVVSLLDEYNVVYVHAGVPCGTCSRARERPLPAHLKRAGAPEPRPLRNARYPMGVPGLRPHERIAVEQANLIYANIVTILQRCNAKGIPWSLENPGNSWLWAIPCIVQLMSNNRWRPVRYTFHNCMFGGPRPKLSCWASTLPALAFLQQNGQCDDKHPHLAWGVQKEHGSWNFATGDEAVYQPELCREAGLAVRSYMETRGFSFADPVTDDLQAAPTAKKARATLLQPRDKVPPLISEFGDTLQLRLRVAAIGSQVSWQANGSEAYGKILRICLPSEGEMGMSGRPPQGFSDYMVGRYRSPEQFLSASKACVHPSDHDPLPTASRATLGYNVGLHHSAVEAERNRQIASITHMKAALAADEARLRDLMPKHRRIVLHNRNFLLLECLRKSCGHEDENIVLDMVRGFDLTGVPKRSGVFPHKLRPRELNESQLRAAANSINKSIAGKMSRSSDPAQDHAIITETAAEKARGWVQGPYTTEALDKLFPEGWVASRRFAIRQNQKWRVIDDYSESWINSAYELNELIDPHTVSDSVNLCVQLLKALGGKSEVLGRTCDLKSAYRQLAVSDESACFAIIVVFNPAGAGGRGSLEYFLQRALPFGAVASVVAFNRFARLLWRIAVTTLKLHITNYFDDVYHAVNS